MMEPLKEIVEIIKILKEFKNINLAKITGFVLLYINITVNIWFQNSRQIICFVQNRDQSPQIYFLVNVLIACMMDVLLIFSADIVKSDYNNLYCFTSFLARVFSLLLWFGVMNFIGGKIFFNVNENEIKRSILYASAWFPLIEVINATTFYFTQSESFYQLMYMLFNAAGKMIADNINSQLEVAILAISIIALIQSVIIFALCITSWVRTIFKGINIATIGQKIKFTGCIFIVVLAVNVINISFTVGTYVLPIYNMQKYMELYWEESYLLNDFIEAQKLRKENKEYKNSVLLYIDELKEIEQPMYTLAYKTAKLEKLVEACDKIVSDNRLPVDYRYPYELYGIVCILQRQNEGLVFLKGLIYQDKEISAMTNFLLNNRADMLEFTVWDYIGKNQLLINSLPPNDYIKYKFFLEKLKNDKIIMKDKKIEMKIEPKITGEKENVVQSLNFKKQFIQDISKYENRFWRIFLKMIDIIP